LRKDEQSDSAATFSHCGVPRGIRPLGSFSFAISLWNNKEMAPMPVQLSAHEVRSMSVKRKIRLKIGLSPPKNKFQLPL
jgi:hypothetical protein